MIWLYVFDVFIYQSDEWFLDNHLFTKNIIKLTLIKEFAFDSLKVGSSLIPSLYIRLIILLHLHMASSTALHAASHIATLRTPTVVLMRFNEGNLFLSDFQLLRWDGLNLTSLEYTGWN